MKNSDKPINPCVIKGRQGFREIPTIPDKNEYGLTKREYFAGLAMQGLLSLYDTSNTLVPNEENIKSMVKMSIFASDKLLKQLENNTDDK